MEHLKSLGDSNDGMLEATYQLNGLAKVLEAVMLTPAQHTRVVDFFEIQTGQRFGRLWARNNSRTERLPYPSDQLSEKMDKFNRIHAGSGLKSGRHRKRISKDFDRCGCC